MPALMVQGTTSSAGKSLLTCALARHFARRGLRVAPFKAQNMSNNARVVEGGEIGVAQYLQALAAGVDPDVRMNPVLLKPEGDTRSQVVVRGRVDHALTRAPWRGRSRTLWPIAAACLDELLAEHDLVVIEGAGSPAEINLADDDFVNMRVARHAEAPVLLVADIDRGGALAHLYGTWALLDPPDRARIAGFVLNRFRGDVALLDPGPAMLEARTGVPTIGVLPWLDHDLPDEDGAGTPRRHGSWPVVAVVRYPTASNLDELRRVEQVADLRWADRPVHLEGADLVVLPGSKHVAGDRDWLAATGMDGAIAAAARRTRVLGICGGLQLLGRALHDPAGVDGSRGGLRLLPVETVFAADKRVARGRLRFADALPEPWTSLSGLEANCYEIRHGVTRADASAVGQPDLACRRASSVTVRGQTPTGVGRFTPEVRGQTPPAGAQVGAVDGNVLGVAVHGLLEDPEVLAALLGARPERSLEATFDLLADAVARHLDQTALDRLVRPK